MGLEQLPPDYGRTRAALHRLACYVVAPARKARTGRIGLLPVDGGFGTPPFDDGSQLIVVGDTIEFRPDQSHAITTLDAAAAFLGVELTPDPGVGGELPPFETGTLDVDPAASR